MVWIALFPLKRHIYKLTVNDLDYQNKLEYTFGPEFLGWFHADPQQI